MASTKPNIKSVKLDSLSLWLGDDGNIHLTTDDADVRDVGFHTYISNNPSSKRYHPSAFNQLARILQKFGKDVPGWEDPKAEA